MSIFRSDNIHLLIRIQRKLMKIELSYVNISYKEIYVFYTL